MKTKKILNFLLPIFIIGLFAFAYTHFFPEKIFAPTTSPVITPVSSPTPTATPTPSKTPKPIKSTPKPSKIKTDGNIIGIDVSKYQGRINWKAVKDSGIEFAIIRAGFRGQAAAGKIGKDSYFDQNAKNAVSAGIKIGVYFYSTAKNETEALDEAKWIIKTIEPFSISYPVVYDFEEWGRNRTTKITKAQATKNAQAFLEYIAKSKYTPMLYVKRKDIPKYDIAKLSEYKCWVADYVNDFNKITYTGAFDMFQYTTKGKVPGVSGNVDLNISKF